jgi:hypothetical protein
MRLRAARVVSSRMSVLEGGEGGGDAMRASFVLDAGRLKYLDIVPDDGRARPACLRACATVLADLVDEVRAPILVQRESDVRCFASVDRLKIKTVASV